MNACLPDVSVTEAAVMTSALPQVGMAAIDLPVTLADALQRPFAHARVRATVNLPLPHIKGIHMSRLYQLLMPLGEAERLCPVRLHSLLRAMIASHEDCGSNAAEVCFELQLLVPKAALTTADLGGWSAYPLQLRASLDAAGVHMQARLSVGYSSTCPCSAALVRQLISDRFRQQFGGQSALTTTEVCDWLQQYGTLATPHSQRSRADVLVSIDPHAADFGLPALLERVENALQTPLQTAVKRADEQAFAALNGSNTMFVEDAARRIKAALTGYYDAFVIDVSHLESLHPHDAIARARSDGSGHLI